MAKFLYLQLIACANVTPVKSTYRWEGKIQKDSEYLMILKTQKELLPEVNKFIKENHPYTVPEGEFIYLFIRKYKDFMFF